MILIIDNYDSFTFNLVQYAGELGAELKVMRNDQFELSQIEDLHPEGVIISPGPGRPENAGLTVPLIARIASRIPLLGVCLGHQAIGYAFDANVVAATQLMHGKTSEIYHQSESIFAGIPNPFVATRYHSLIIGRENLPPDLVITAETREGTIMGVRHKTYPTFGVQFHPESIMTLHGKKLIKNFLRICKQNQTRKS